MGRDGESVARNPALAQSPDSTTNIVILLDDEGRVQTRLKGPPGTAADLTAVSPDGSRLAVIWTGPKEWVFTLYDPDSGKPTATSAQDIGYTWALVFSPDGTRIATAGEDGLTRLWDTSTGTMTAQCRGHTRKVLSVAFRPDGRRLVTTSADGTVRQWDSATGREVESPYDRHIGEVVTAAYSPDGLWVASGGTDRTVRVWEAANRHDVAVLHGPHRGRQRTGVYRGRPPAGFGESVGEAGYAGDGTVRLWEVGRQAGTSVLRGHTSYIYPVAYSPDGRWIASGSWDKTVRLWDAVTGESCAILPHPGSVRALAFSPDSSWLVSGCASGRIVAHLERRDRPAREQVQGTRTGCYSGDRGEPGRGPHRGCGRATEARRSWKPRPARKSTPFGWPRPATKKSLAYSPDGRLLAGTGEDGTQIDIWDTQTRRRSARLTGHTGLVYSVAFSGDGRLLASASGDRTVRVWDVAAAKCVAVLTGHTDEVFSAVFHPDGKRLASAGRDRAIWLWDLATGQEVARLEGHTNYVFSLAFSPDGTSLVSGSGDGTVRIWDTEPPALRHQARREAEALRPEAERLVARLFAELHEPDRGCCPFAGRLRA